MKCKHPRVEGGATTLDAQLYFDAALASAGISGKHPITQPKVDHWTWLLGCPVCSSSVPGGDAYASSAAASVAPASKSGAAGLLPLSERLPLLRSDRPPLGLRQSAAPLPTRRRAAGHLMDGAQHRQSEEGVQGQGEAEERSGASVVGHDDDGEYQRHSAEERLPGQYEGQGEGVLLVESDNQRLPEKDEGRSIDDAITPCLEVVVDVACAVNEVQSGHCRQDAIQLICAHFANDMRATPTLSQ
eukprot:CAMPEP_0204518754 /NCGR_PEP_ID=MMETSP0661-20131031/4369_1 /ASSEMBLY_ACC=CAM_ASM_000606 /TAXON_ID=109239 /ORGANISM="Alexandrium margalefi, Strain AMGDE01CS-322" /LENGTH=243 /DNA_ID=CAMNT_0051524217 /DNA_START=100 /DNA_END=830 /DNA_ORIENTATION=+